MKELAGPFELLPGCRLWLAVFGRQHHASASIDVKLAESELSEEDFRRWQRYRAPEKRRQPLNSRRVAREVILSERELCFVAEQWLKAACGFSHREGIHQTSQSRGAATESLAESLRSSGQRHDGFENARSGNDRGTRMDCSTAGIRLCGIAANTVVNEGICLENNADRGVRCRWRTFVSVSPTDRFSSVVWPQITEIPRGTRHCLC